MKKQISLLVTVVLLAGIAMFSACKKDEVKSYAMVNLIQASLSAPIYKLYANDVSLIPNVLSYGDNTAYLDVLSGSQTFKIVDGTVDTMVTKISNSLNTNIHYSMFLIDTFPKVHSLLLADDLTPPSNGNALIRFVQLSPNAQIIDVVNTIKSSTIFAGLTYKDATGFKSVSPGVYDLAIRCDRTTDTVTYNMPTIVLSSGKIYTVYTKGILGATGKEAFSASMITNLY
ncbi:MAG: DUF4397 domain-containing protein [Phycisphaerales bacterium]|nr:DUF4397 domain-containing protein [Phycisphaerales bacterium]